MAGRKMTVKNVRAKPDETGKVKIEKTPPKGQSTSAKIASRKKQRVVPPAKAGRVK